MERFTLKDFNNFYPDDNACLSAIFHARYGDLEKCPKCSNKAKFYRIGTRKVYGCQYCGYQLSPTADTIFHKSSTSLKNWFYALFLFSNSKNGVSAKELERHLGVTYKTAWRMAKQIRILFNENIDQLMGIVEVDETYFGGSSKSKRWEMPNPNKKTPIIGMVERNGRIVSKPVTNTGKQTLLNEIQKRISPNAKVVTDELQAYKTLSKLGFDHAVIKHAETYVLNDLYTNTIEGFWSQLKRSVKGTYHSISPKYLSSYVNEFAYRYNYRSLPVFPLLISKAVKPI